MTSFRTPMSRVKGLGAAKHGVGAFIAQRVSAAALVLLMLWGVGAVLSLAHMGYGDAVGWLHSPWNAIPMALLLGVAFLHMHIGMREIVVDYIEKPATRNALLILNIFACGAGAATGVFCVLKVAFASGAS